jgi:hypothetical protein
MTSELSAAAAEEGCDGLMEMGGAKSLFTCKYQ